MKYLLVFRKFKVNKYLELKLEGDETVIYVNGNKFGQCKFLLLNIPIDEITSLGEIESIDEAAEKLDNSLEPIRNKRINNIPPEVEFWGHCSNLQVWVESNYDTRLIHKNLAFHLLHKLSKAGDPVAKNMFKEEIVKRFLSGHPSVMGYLFENGFINYLEIQKECIRDETYDYLIEQLKEQEIKENFVIYENRIIGVMSRRKRLTLTEMHYRHIFPELPYKKIDDITKVGGLEKLKDLEVLDMNGNNVSEIKGLENLINLKSLDISHNKITEIKGLDKLVNLEKLNLGGSKIIEINGLGNLINLKVLNLSGNRITELKGLENLVKLRELHLRNNNILEIKGLKNLIHLERLILYKNPITDIKGLENLKNLKYLGINGSHLPNFGTNGKKYVEFCKKK